MPKKELIILTQAEPSAMQQKHESNILVLSQVIELLHKRVDIYSKLLETVGPTVE
jgi:hypothetical protein